MTARPFLNWFEEALPALVFQHIIQAQAVKVCSSISPIFGVIARRYGYETYVLPVSGHVLNVVITPEGPLQVDLSAVQFQICNFLRDEDITEQDPYGTRGSMQRLIRHIIRDPRRAVNIDRYYGSMKSLTIPNVEPFTQHYLDSYHRALRDVRRLRQKDPRVYDDYKDIPYLREWELERNPEPQAHWEYLDAGLSPLQYDKGGPVQRIVLRDPTVTTPPDKGEYYFAHIERLIKYSPTGKLYKKPKKETTPGIDDNSVVAFLDYHDFGDGLYYIDYIKSRTDQRGKGYAGALVDYFYRSRPDATLINWGKMMQPEIGHLLGKMKRKYPQIQSTGSIQYRSE